MPVSRYIKIPLITAMLSSFGCALFALFDKELLGQTRYSFLKGLIIGFLILLLNDAMVRKRVKRLDKDSYNVRQERRLLLNLPYQEAFDLCHKSMSSLGKNFKVLKEDSSTGLLKVKTKLKLLDWNSNSYIEFRVNKVNDNTTEVFLLSYPTWVFQVLDGGVNATNVEIISEYLAFYGKGIDVKLLEEKPFWTAQAQYAHGSEISNQVSSDR